MRFEHNKMDAALLARARVAYELGRLRAALVRAALLAAAAAAVGSWLVDARAWIWAPFTFTAWTLLGWRGGALLTGATYGLAAGAITCLLPLSLLRPCCRAGMVDMAATCTMPGMCVMAGALVAVPLAALAMRRCGTRPREAAAGMALGVLSLATVKCSALFWGEAFGLLGGVALGIAATAVLDSMPRLRAR